MRFQKNKSPLFFKRQTPAPSRTSLHELTELADRSPFPLLAELGAGGGTAIAGVRAVLCGRPWVCSRNGSAKRSVAGWSDGIGKTL